MGKVFWIMGIVGVLSVILIGRHERGDFAGMSYFIDGPEGAIVASGLSAQIELIEEIADQYGWKEDCRDQAGPLTRVQFTPTFWARFSSRDETYNAISPLATSSALLVNPSSDPQGCGTGPSTSSAQLNEMPWEPEQIREVLLAYGTRSELDSFRSVAAKCELDGLVTRELTAPEREQIGGDIPSDWLGLVGTLTRSNQNNMFCFGLVSSNQMVATVPTDR